MSSHKNIFGLRIFNLPAIILFLFLNIPFIRSYFLYYGLRWIYIFLFSFCLSFILTPVIGRIAIRLGILDIPDKRKIHGSSTPLLGGLVIMISLSASLTANMVLEREMVVLLLGGLVLGFVGLLDDWKGLSARLKLFIQVAVVLILIYNGIILDLLPPRTTWGYICNLILTVIWIVGITNAMNFFDGMDGLATGLSAVIAVFIGIASFQTSQHVMGWIAIAVLGSCLGFFPFNFKLRSPAAIFLGDAGSTFLGFVLAALAIQGYWADNSRIVSFAMPTLIFWILIFDMVYITMERVITGKVKTVGEWIRYVGTDHLHHRLAHVLGGQKRSVLFIYFLSSCLGISAIVLRYARTIDAILLIIQALIIVVLLTILERRGHGLSEKEKI